MFYDSGYMAGMHGLWWLFWLVLLAGLLFFGRDRFVGRGDRTSETPHEVLRRRLASGEVTPAEYEERKALLEHDSGRPS